MKKWYLLIGFICFQLAVAYSVPSIDLGENVIITVGNEQYNMSTSLPFSSITLGSTYVIFNNTGFYITSTNSINMSLYYISNNFASASEGDSLIQFDANTIGGNVLFTIAGFTSNEEYTIERDNHFLTTTQANAQGRITFTNSDWSDHEFMIVEAVGPSLNASELYENPFAIIFSPYTDLLGNSFWLIPLSFICVALYMKTRNVPTVSAFMIGSGVILGSGAIFSTYPEMALVYYIFAALGIVGLIIGIYFMRKV